MRPERSSKSRERLDRERTELVLLIGDVERLTGANLSLQRNSVSGAFTERDFGAIADDVLFLLRENSLYTEAQNRVRTYVVKNKLVCATGQ